VIAAVGRVTRRRRSRPARRGVVLVVVILVVGVAIVVASGMVARSTGDRLQQSGEQRRVQQRIAAFSGLRVTMAALAQDREAILDGRSPLPPPEEEVLWTADGQEWIVRRLPVGPGGATIAAEAGKLDLATVERDQLLATGVLDPETIDAILAARDAAPGRRLPAVEELAAAPGVDPAAVLGPLEDLRIRSAARGESRDVAERVLERLSAGGVETAADLLTVHAVEPSVRRDGRRRIVLPLGRDQDVTAMRRQLEDELVRDVSGGGIGSLLGTLLEGRTRLDRPGAIVAELLRFNVPPEVWGPVLDAFSTEPTDEHVGRLDLNTASAAALRAVPGIDEATAEAIVDAREGLDADERWTITWPVMRGIVEPAAFAAMADRLTTRCFTWRVRVAVGRRSSTAGGDEPLGDLTVFEAVVDLTGSTPRLAELRDVTHLELAAQLVAADLLAAADAAGGVAADEDAFVVEPPAFEPPAFEPPAFDPAIPRPPAAPAPSRGPAPGGLVSEPAAAPARGPDPGPGFSPASPQPPDGWTAPPSPPRRRGARWLGPEG
jgi:hypothetical protein